MHQSYEGLGDHSKENHLQKCFYLMTLLKARDPKVWEHYREEFEQLKPEGSYEFYRKLVEVYAGLVQEVPAPKKASKKPALKKKAAKKTAKKTVKKVAKKAPAKKAVKKKSPTKKKAPVKKKTTKKPVKKKSKK